MSSTPIINLSGYRFTKIPDPVSLQHELKSCLSASGVKGAIVLADEGINITIAGTRSQTNEAVACFDNHEILSGIWLKESTSAFVPHKRLRVRVRAEIIAFDGSDSVAKSAMRPQASDISPHVLDNWLAQNRQFTLLDTRNDYEIESGTFKRAVHLDIKHFRHFKKAIKTALAQGSLDKSQAMVTFCTGGIRCEKAVPWLMAEGFKEVYQIEGGLLHYLQQTEASHWQGDCFVFDDRVELSTELKPTGAGLCDHCQLAVPAGTQCDCHLGVHHHATYQLPE